MPYFTNTHNRHRLFYREQGAGPLLLLLPGNTASSVCHEDDLAYFGQWFHVMSLDFAGTGQSDRLAAWPDDWYEQGAQDAAALIMHVGKTQALVIGTSGGGFIALLMAILYPDRVTAAIADSCIERFSPTHLLQLLAERQQHTPGQTGFWQFAQGDDWRQVVDADTAFMRRFAEQGGDPFRGRLKDIRCPVLFTASLADEMLPAVASQIASMTEQIAGSRALVFREGNHPLMWSRADDFREACLYFFRATGCLPHQTDGERGNR